MNKLTFQEFTNLTGWGKHTFIWGASGAWNKTVEEYEWYIKNTNRTYFSKEENELYGVAILAIDYEFDKKLRKLIKTKKKQIED